MQQKTILQKQAEIVAHFTGSLEERYKKLIRWGRKAPPLSDEHKIDDNLLAGCQSRVWLVTQVMRGESNSSDQTEQGSQAEQGGQAEQGDPAGLGEAEQKKDLRLVFLAESDAAIVQGLVSLLVYIYSGHTPQEILQSPPDFIQKLGFRQHLSRTRVSGLATMVKRIQYFALAVSERERETSQPGE